MEEILKAIDEKDTKKLANLLYYKVDELSDEQLEEVLKKAEQLALEKKDYELYKLVVYYYHEFLEIDKISEFEELAEKEGSFEVKFHLADLYFLIGELEKSLAMYQGLLEEEIAKGNVEHVAEIYYNMALIYEELQDYEKAYELLDLAEKKYRELGKEDEIIHIQVYKAYVKFEMGNTYEAKAMLGGLLPKVLELGNDRLLAEIHLSFEEIFEEADYYEAALQECLYAMLRARGTEYYDVAFDALVDVLWQLFLEDSFETVYNNMDMFKNAFPELAEFFEGVKYLALFKDEKVDEEKLKEVLEKVKDKRLLDLLEFLGEAEL
jgi:tetratricopeptide (TPR) repeat protein